MEIKSITYLASLDDITDIFDYNMDVAVKLEDGHEYVVVVATQKNLLSLMNNERSDFLSPGDPMIIVRKFTKNIVEKALKAYAEDDAYFLKFYSAELDVKTLNVLKNRSIERYKFLDKLLEKNESIDIENYDLDLIDFNSNMDNSQVDNL